jgi:hypothetical protein
MFKKAEDISEEDLKDYSVWSAFYEICELELLDDLGIDVDTFKKELEAIRDIDDYWYPVPEAAILMPFKYLYLSSSIKTSNGTELVGYRTRVSLTVLYKGKRYFFNKAAADMCERQEHELSIALNEPNIFPLSVHIEANNTNELFTY